MISAVKQPGSCFTPLIPCHPVFQITQGLKTQGCAGRSCFIKSASGRAHQQDCHRDVSEVRGGDGSATWQLPERRGRRARDDLIMTGEHVRAIGLEPLIV